MTSRGTGLLTASLILGAWGGYYLWTADKAPSPPSAADNPAPTSPGVNGESPLSDGSAVISGGSIELREDADVSIKTAGSGETSLPVSDISAGTLEAAKAKAWEYYSKQADFGRKSITSGMPIPFTGEDLRSLFELGDEIDADGLAMTVEAKTAGVNAELLALGDQYQLALDAAVRVQFERPPADFSREPIKGGKKDKDEFLRIHGEAEGWHFVYRLRLSENPELQRLLDQKGPLVEKRARDTERVLKELLGDVNRREGD